MAAFDDRANLVASYLLIITVLRRRREREAGRYKHRFWIRIKTKLLDFQLLNLIYLFYSPWKTCYIYTRIFGLLPRTRPGYTLLFWRPSWL